MTKDIINSIKNNILIEDEMYMDYIEELVNKYELEDYIDGVYLSSDELTGFENKTGILFFNPDQITWSVSNEKSPSLDMLVNEFEIRNNMVFQANKANLYNLFVIRHEIEHIIQNKTITTGKDSYIKDLLTKDTISLILDTNELENYFYINYHDKFYSEYNANIVSYMSTLKKLNKLKIKELDNLLKKINNIIAKWIIYCYRNIENNGLSTPIKNMSNLYDIITKKCEENGVKLEINISYPKAEIKEKEKTELEKIKYGLNISSETYNYIKNVSTGKIKTLNLFEQIKN